MDIKSDKSIHVNNEGRFWTSIKNIVIYTGAGFALGSAVLPFGAVPFGFAVLCVGGLRCVLAYIGLCLSLFFAEQPIIMLTAYTLCLGVRAAVSLLGDEKSVSIGLLANKIFREPPSMRVIGAAVGAFALGLSRLIKSGFLYYDLFGALIGLCVAVLAGVLWYFADSRRHTFLSSLALASLCAACVWGLGAFSVYGISLSVLVCMLASLVLTRYKGMRVGVLTALASGLCVSFELAPLFVFGAVCYSILGVFSPILGCVSCISVGLAWGVYMDGLGALTELLPALLSANVIFLAISKLYSKNGHSEGSESIGRSVGVDGEYIARLELAELKEKGELVSKSISELCELLGRVDEQPMPSENIEDVLKKARYSRSGLTAEVGEIGIRAHSDTCTLHADTADCLLAVSEYLGSIMELKRSEYTVDGELTEKLCACLSKSNIKINECAVLGETEKRAVFFCDAPKLLEEHSRELCELTQKVFGFTVLASDVKQIGERSYMSVSRGRILRASIAGKKRNAEDEREFCGDSFGMLTSTWSSQAAAFICDGMGSGREAAGVSGMCSLFLQKLLSMGMNTESVSTAINLTAAFLRRRNDTLHSECTSTLDVCVLDLRSAHAQFYKCGAAPTYIFRDGFPFKLRSRTMPIGIMEKADIGHIEMELLPGDTVVMVSDGVGEDKNEFFDYLRDKLLTFDAKQLAGTIMEYANKLGCKDDASVVVMKVEELGIGELS